MVFFIGSDKLVGQILVCVVSIAEFYYICTCMSRRNLGLYTLRFLIEEQ